MKPFSHFLLCFPLIFFTGSIFAQDTAKVIAAIRREFKIINSDHTLKKVTLSAEEFLDDIPDGGAKLTGFYKGSQIQKIVSWVGLSYGNEILEFYFKNNQLIFVYEEFYSFIYDNKKQELRLDSTEKTFTGRYYFENNKLIDYITTGHNRFDIDDLEPEKILLKEANDNKKFLDRKKGNGH